MNYNTNFKLKCINSFKSGDSSISKTALKAQIPKQTLARWIKLHKLFGAGGLENRKSGAKEKMINPEFEKLVLNMWKKEKRSAYKMRKDLKKDIKRNGHNISERQIKKVYKKHRLQMNR